MALKTGTILSVVIIVTLAIVVYVNWYQQNAGQPNLRISVGEAKARRFGLIIDTRTPKERDQLGYYPNSIPISLEKLAKEVPLDISSKNTHILVYSNADYRAVIAAQLLYSMGYRNVRYINETYLSLMPGSK